MKQSIKIFFLLFVCIANGLPDATAQDIPLFSQKLSNSFLYNPSIAGQQYGSITLAHRSLFSKVEGSAKDVYFSAHKPYYGKHIGLGVNLYSEKVNFINNVFTSVAFAYHMVMPGDRLLSIGLAGEFNSIGFDRALIVGEDSDPLVRDRLSRLDFSTGISYWDEYFEVGLSVNRMASMMKLAEKANLLSEYYSIHYKHKIKLGSDDRLIEPMFSFRQMSDVSHIWSFGGYYTHKKKLLGGLSYQSSKNVNFTLAGNISKTAWAGISYQLNTSPYRRNLGNSIEFVLRLDIENDDPVQKSHFTKPKKSDKKVEKAKKRRRNVLR